MKRKLYDLFYKEIDVFREKDCKVYYVECDCGHLAIRKNKTTKDVFKCSLCKREYRQNKVSRSVEQIF